MSYHYTTSYHIRLKNGNSGAAARKEEREQWRHKEEVYLGYVAIAMFCHQPELIFGKLTNDSYSYS